MSGYVVDFYTNSNVLITGGSGFFGKILLEKLLRTVENISIYLVIREKREMHPEKRLIEILNDPVFDLMKREVPEYLRKVHVIRGDLSCLGLDLSEEDEALLIKNIDVVFHGAALLNMNCSLKVATETNIRGTHELFKLCRNMKHLKSFVLISSVYSNCNHDLIEEKLYKPDVPPELLMDMSQKLDEDYLEKLEKNILGKYPNTYCFTKGVAEYLTRTSGKDLPVGIFRPSIVTSTLKDPVVGWTDNIYGPLGMELFISLGILRISHCDMSTQCNIVPVDLCVNALLCSAWEIDQKHRNKKLIRDPNYNHITKPQPLHHDVPIYNYCNRKNLTWADFHRLFQIGHKYAFAKTIWAPSFIGIRNRFLYHVLRIVLHVIPAYLIDLVLTAMKKKAVMRKYYRKVEKFQALMSYFAKTDWTIDCNNIDALWQNIDSNSRAQFPFDFNVVEFEDYVPQLSLGLKKYYLKDDGNLEKDARKLERYKMTHKTFKLVAGCATFWFVVKLTGKILRHQKLFKRQIQGWN